MVAGFVGVSLLCGGTAATAAATPVGVRGGHAPSRYAGKPLQVLVSESRERGFHVVAKGETLWRISRRYGTSVGELLAWNGISKPEDLRAGARLKVPKASKQSFVRQPPSGSTDKEASKPPRETVRSGGRRYRFGWPVQGPITSRFGRRRGQPHDGIDIGAVEGSKVLAVDNGEVVFAGPHGGYGNLVLVRHSDGLVTVYAHNQRNLVRKGQQVIAGQVIARVGSTGRATGPHLHFEVRRGVKPTNPLGFLPP